MLIDVTLVPSDSDVVSLTSVRRDPGKPNWYDLNAVTEKHFHVIDGQLQEISPEEVKEIFKGVACPRLSQRPSLSRKSRSLSM